MEKKGIIFDVDGTLWDSSKEVVIAWNQALARHPELKRQITIEDMQGYMGKPMDDIMRLMLPNVEHATRMRLLDELVEAEHDYLAEVGGTLYPELAKVLQELHENYHLYIVSNCQDGYIQCFLKVNKMEELFEDFECWGRTMRPKGDNIAMIAERNGLDKAVYVGDTLGDYLATKAAGLPFIHAAYGFGEAPEAEEAVQSLGELAAAVKRLIG